MRDTRVLLVYPPFGALSFPSIGLSLLKSQLRREGIACDIRYLNYDFLDRLPGDFVERLALFDGISRRNEYSLGDWIFNGCVFSPERTAALDARFAALVREQGEDDEFLERCFAVKREAVAFVEWAADNLPWSDYQVVGFHSIFSQTLAALGLARAVKARHPQLITLFGGPSATGEMGEEVLRQFPQIDFVVQGEADQTIGAIVRGLANGTSIDGIAGVMHRAAAALPRVPPAADPIELMPLAARTDEVHVNPIALVQDVDGLATPDFDDFFARFNGRGYERGIDVFLPIENSRGCWWGAKHHCTFCGLNSNSMMFRRKRPETVFDELVAQAARYDIRSFACVDSILDMSYFETLLPRLRDARLDLRLFYEVKANMTRRQVHLLADAGITLLQPGLEHLASSVLALMRKGTTFLQNVQFLKWSRERSMTVFWAVLYGFPGESLAAYEEMAARIPLLFHLFPPKLPVRVRVDRFSPLFTTPTELGLAAVRPARGYHHVYPFDEAVLRKLAYHFEGDYADRDPALNDRIRATISGPIAAWNERYFRGGAALDFVAGSQCTLVRDTRASSPGRYLLLDGPHARVLDACEAHTSRQQLDQRVTAPDPEGPAARGVRLAFEDMVIDAALGQAARLEIPVLRPVDGRHASVAQALEWLETHGLVVRDGGRLLGLASAMSAPEGMLDRRRPDPATLQDIAATRKVVLEGVA